LTRGVVADSCSSPTLIAWSLNDDSSYKIRLPAIPLDISAQNNIVIIVTIADVLKWGIGGALSLVNTSQATSYFRDLVEGIPTPWSHTTTVFHPMTDDHFFLIYQSRHTSLLSSQSKGEDFPIIRRIVIQEFVEGKPEYVYHTDYTTTRREIAAYQSDDVSVDPGYVRVIDNHGTRIRVPLLTQL
jgi:hypothetical protein